MEKEKSKIPYGCPDSAVGVGVGVSVRVVVSGSVGPIVGNGKISGVSAGTNMTLMFGDNLLMYS